MEPFVRLVSCAVPIDRANVDTDAIIPKQFMKSIRRTGFGDNLFDEWRYLDRGEPGQDCSLRPLNKGFALNDPRYKGASILLTRDNFGCGSSREHAVWALRDHGIRALIAPSFADIFEANCYKNGLLPIVLSAQDIQGLFDAVQHAPDAVLCIDLVAQTLARPDGLVHAFHVDAFKRRCLLEGLDDIALTLQRSEAIRIYEEWRRGQEPWLFPRASNEA
jgi:3-isopropylmalate/(R)-2-methylmalate dehydratase small subunit